MTVENDKIETNRRYRISGKQTNAFWSVAALKRDNQFVIFKI